MRGEVLCGATEDRAKPAHALHLIPPYIRRGDEVEARTKAYRESLERFYNGFALILKEDERDLYEKLKGASPTPVVYGYQVLPRIVPDAARPTTRPRATSTSFSWRRVESFLDTDIPRLDRLEETLARLSGAARKEARDALESMISEYRVLAANQKLIESHIQYNRFWQREIDRNRARYHEWTALHDAVLERQAILDALSAADDTAFRRALSGIQGMDRQRVREHLESELGERERQLSREIHEATDAITLPSFLRVEHPTSHLWIVHVPFSTDIEDAAFVRLFRTAVEHVWRVRDGDEEFRVQLAITAVPATELYRNRTAPRHGEQIDLQKHIARFPQDGGVLTTGANSTHVTGGRCIVLSPHDLAPHVLAHEFGHVLGFRDVYFRSFRDLAADGYEVMEVVADPEDIMGAPGSGPVLRRHFERIIEKAARQVHSNSLSEEAR